MVEQSLDRALGNRSLLGDSRYDIKDTVNEIKKEKVGHLLLILKNMQMNILKDQIVICSL